MKVLLSWLKEFVEVEAEPQRLADDLTLVGLAVDAVEPLGGDTLLELDITTNRVDCMNVYGVAREVSVLYQLPLRPMDLSFTQTGPPAAEGLDVTVEAADLCPRFCARVLDVKMGTAPSWMRDRLEAVGVRSINSIVDVTNYVMMEMGQPSHAFDLARVPGGRLHVRWGKAGESLVTLDGVERKLGGRVGVVAGPESPLALAGIMGGASSEVSPSTRAVALEAAYWDPLAVRRAAKALGMHTEASHRFERGADPEAPGAATARICHLLGKIDAGSTRPGLIDRRTLAMGPRKARLRASRVSLVLGDVVAEAESRRILEGLGFAVAATESEGAAVTIPSWRGDVSREIDLVEEVGRYHGLDRIPSTIPSTGVVGGLQPWQVRERAARQAMVAAGLTEVVNYAFVSETEAAAAPGARVALANPLSEEQAVLRSSLVVPGLLDALRANLRQGRRDVAVFEIGRVFMPGEPLPVEERRLGLLLSGASRPAHWSEKGRPADFFDAKGVAESVLARLAADVTWTRRDAPPFLQPGKAAVARRGDLVVGYVGAVRPDLAAAFESKEEVLVAELGLGDLLAEIPPAERFRALDRFPPVSRDLSVLCDAGLDAAELLKAIRGAAGELLRSVTIIDRYDRPPVPEGQVSLTVTLLFQSQERTLTGEEVQEAVERVVRDLRGRRAEIRGE